MSNDWFGSSWDADDGGSMDSKNRSPLDKRLWIPSGKTVRLMFITDRPPVVWEHSWYGRKVGDDKSGWRNHGLCRRYNKIGNEVCRPHEEDDKDDKAKVNVYKIGFFKVIDLTGEFTDNKGNTHRYFERVYPAKTGTKDRPGVFRKLSRYHDQYGGLNGCIFDVLREGENSPNVGNDFTFIEKVDPMAWGREHDPKFKEEKYRPFDWEELLKAPSDEELKRAFESSYIGPAENEQPQQSLHNQPPVEEGGWGDVDDDILF